MLWVCQQSMLKNISPNGDQIHGAEVSTVASQQAGSMDKRYRKWMNERMTAALINLHFHIWISLANGCYVTSAAQNKFSDHLYKIDRGDDWHWSPGRQGKKKPKQYLISGMTSSDTNVLGVCLALKCERWKLTSLWSYSFLYLCFWLRKHLWSYSFLYLYFRVCKHCQHYHTPL